MSDGRARSRADQDAALVQAPASGGWAGKGNTAARVYAGVQCSPMSPEERAARPAPRESLAPSSEDIGRALCPHLFLQTKAADGAPAAEPEPATGGTPAAELEPAAGGSAALLDARALAKAQRNNPRFHARLGYDPTVFGGPADVASAAFAEAVATYQQAHGLAVDGMAGPNTCAHAGTAAATDEAMEDGVLDFDPALAGAGALEDGVLAAPGGDQLEAGVLDMPGSEQLEAGVLDMPGSEQLEAGVLDMPGQPAGRAAASRIDAAVDRAAIDAPKEDSLHETRSTIAVQRSVHRAVSLPRVRGRAGVGVASDPNLTAPAPLQRLQTGEAQATDPRAIAAAGVQGGGTTLPHLDTIQHSFGRHDVTGVQAHVGGAAADAATAIGAEAYATGTNVAFRAAPDLHTAAHEAAHVVQQRAGVQLKGGVGEAGDHYEQHADQVADAVVAGKSAEPLLDAHAPAPPSAAVQRKESAGASERASVALEPGAERAEPREADHRRASAEAAAPNAPSIEKLEAARVHLDIIQRMYETELDPLEEQAFAGTESLIDGSLAAIQRVQEWINEEKGFGLEEFQASYAAAALHTSISSALGVIKGPDGMILSTVYGLLSGLHMAGRQNRTLERVRADHTFLNRVQALTNDETLRGFVMDQRSHTQGIGFILGGLRRGAFRGTGGGHHGDTLANVERHLGQLRALERAGQGSTVHHHRNAQDTYAQAAGLFNNVLDDFGELRAAVRDLYDAAGRTPQVGDEALRQLMEQFAQFRAERGGVELSGIAHPGRGPKLLTLFLSLDYFGGRPNLSAPTQAHLRRSSFADFARLGIPARATINLEKHALDLRQDADGSRAPITADHASLDRLVLYEKVTADGTRYPVSDGQLALDMIWGLLHSTPLSGHVG